MRRHLILRCVPQVGAENRAKIASETEFFFFHQPRSRTAIANRPRYQVDEIGISGMRLRAWIGHHDIIRQKVTKRIARKTTLSHINPRQLFCQARCLHMEIVSSAATPALVNHPQRLTSDRVESDSGQHSCMYSIQGCRHSGHASPNLRARHCQSQEEFSKIVRVLLPAMF